MSAWVASRRQAAFERDFRGVVDPNDNKTNPKTIDKLNVEHSTDAEGQGSLIIDARDLTIKNSDNIEHWQWNTDSDGIDVVEVAEMVKEKELDARGSISTKNFVHGNTYKVSFLLKMTQDSTLTWKMVNLNLSLPGIHQKKKGRLPTPTDQWEELEVGRFKMTAKNVGVMSFSMDQSFENWENGLIIRGVEIKRE